MKSKKVSKFDNLSDENFKIGSGSRKHINKEVNIPPQSMEANKPSDIYNNINNLQLNGKKSKNNSGFNIISHYDNDKHLGYPNKSGIQNSNQGSRSGGYQPSVNAINNQGENDFKSNMQPTNQRQMESQHKTNIQPINQQQNNNPYGNYQENQPQQRNDDYYSYQMPQRNINAEPQNFEKPSSKQEESPNNMIMTEEEYKKMMTDYMIAQHKENPDIPPIYNHSREEYESYIMYMKSQNPDVFNLIIM